MRKSTSVPSPSESIDTRALFYCPHCDRILPNAWRHLRPIRHADGKPAAEYAAKLKVSRVFITNTELGERKPTAKVIAFYSEVRQRLIDKGWDPELLRSLRSIQWPPG